MQQTVLLLAPIYAVVSSCSPIRLSLSLSPTGVIFQGNPLLTAALPLATFYTSIIFNFVGRRASFCLRRKCHWQRDSDWQQLYKRLECLLHNTYRRVRNTHPPPLLHNFFCECRQHRKIENKNKNIAAVSKNQGCRKIKITSLTIISTLIYIQKYFLIRSGSERY